MQSSSLSGEAAYLTTLGVGEQRNRYGTRSITAPLLPNTQFPALGKLEILQESLGFVAGYGIKCYLISQDINQLKSRETGYGPRAKIPPPKHSDSISSLPAPDVQIV